MAEWIKNHLYRLSETANSVFMCDAAARSIRRQEAAFMLGNGDDFHLGDAAIVAELSVLLVILMTDGFFVSI